MEASSLIHYHDPEAGADSVDGKHVQSVYTSEGSTIVSASVSDPFAVVRRADGTAVFFIGDSVAKTVSQSPYLPDGEVGPFGFSFGVD